MPNNMMLTKDEKEMLKKTYWYSLGTFMSSCQVIMQARTFACMMQPGLEKWYKDDPEAYREAFSRHANEYFNTHQVMVSLLGGVGLALEKERYEHGTVDGGTISGIKASLMGPTAGIGDSFFFNCFRVIVAGIAISLSANGNLMGPLFFLLVYGGGLLLVKYYAVVAGYKYGTSLITTAFESGAVQMITEAACSLGAIMVGALIAGNVKVAVKLVPNVFGATVDIQAMLDTIMPGLLSLLLWWACYKTLQKGMSPIKLIFIIMGVCIVLSFFGILQFYSGSF